ncbi:MAG: 2'-5' RNA ligase family protein [Bacteroidota bacterium]
MGTQGIIKRTAKFNHVMENIPPAYMRSLHMNEYLLVLNLNEDLRNRIMLVKQKFAEKYETNLAKFLKPHIALVHFKSWDLMEEKISQRIKHIAMGAAPFKIELKDFGSFPTHSIYINVSTKIPVINLVKQLKEVQRLMKADPEQDPHFISDPYIAIGRKLLPWQFEKAWQEYEHKHFTAKFIADSMLLVKRPAGGKAYQIVERFDFQNLPVATTQASLFAY